MPLLQLLIHSDEEMMSKPPQEMLPVFAKAFLRVAENPTSIALMKLLLGEAFRQPSVAQALNTIGPSRSIAFLTRYLARQMSLDVLRPMNPRAAARCFIGPLVAYLITREVFLQSDAQQLDADTMVATTVEIFLRGMQTSPDLVRQI
jgi:TetR/AcrR family transcriptional regulator, mexJK operon transcriptional repressor